VPESGIYRVSHSPHRLPHEVILLRGKSFPRCEQCGEEVIFQLVQPAPHITSDSGFRVILFSLPVIPEDEDKAA
jgi:hypothetical protein